MIPKIHALFTVLVTTQVQLKYWNLLLSVFINLKEDTISLQVKSISLLNCLLVGWSEDQIDSVSFFANMCVWETSPLCVYQPQSMHLFFVDRMKRKTNICQYVSAIYRTSSLSVFVHCTFSFLFRSAEPRGFDIIFNATVRDGVS